MATITPTVINAVHGNKSVRKATWAAMALNDVGAPFPYIDFCDRSVQVFGTWGTGGNLQWQGSNDGGVNWAVIVDPQGNFDIISNRVVAAEMVCELVRPKVTAGDGTTSVTVVLIARTRA